MIRIVLPGIPPSVNHAYFTKGGRRVLSKVGRAYILDVRTRIVREYPGLLGFFRENKPYVVYFRFILPQLYNAGFATGATKTRFKVIDVTNRVKLLEDALMDAAGIDDSQHVAVLTHKALGLKEETHIFIWSPEEEKTPLDEVLALP